MSKNLHIACSPLTGTIFAGKVLKKCVWAQGKQDLTIEALFAVAEHVTHFGKPVELSDTSGKLLFKIFVDRPAEKQFMTQKSEPSATEPMESIAQYVESLENPEDARAIRLMAGENDALRARVAELEAKIENIFFEFQHWTIIHNPKPIPPSCGVDWDFVHAEYDGENGLAGTGKDPVDCLRQIIELMRGASL